MARNEVEVERERPPLKHLGFVRSFALLVLALGLKLYEFVKQHSGPLRGPLSFAKRVFMTLAGPFYRKFKDVPDDLLVFLDKKIEGIITDKRTPAMVKRVISLSLLLTHQAFQLTQTFIHNAQVSGIRVAVVFTIEEFNKFLLSQFVGLWVSAIKAPSFQKLAGRFLPTATGLLEKYNQGINSLTKKGFTALSRLPIVPIDKIGSVLIPGEGNLLNQGITNAVGGLSEVMKTGSASLSPAPIINEATKVAGAAATKVVGDAAKVADAAASAAQDVVGNVMETGSAALGSLPLVGGVAMKIATGAASNGERATSKTAGDAAKAVNAAASAAENIAGDVMGTGSAALGSLPLVGGAMKIAKGAASKGEKTVSKAAGGAQSVVGNAMETGSQALGSLPLLGKAMKVAATAASSGEKTVNDVVQKGSSALESVPVVGDAAKVVNFGAASTHKMFGNAMDKLRLP